MRYMRYIIHPLGLITILACGAEPGDEAKKMGVSAYKITRSAEMAIHVLAMDDQGDILAEASLEHAPAERVLTANPTLSGWYKLIKVQFGDTFIEHASDIESKVILPVSGPIAAILLDEPIAREFATLNVSFKASLRAEQTHGTEAAYGPYSCTYDASPSYNCLNTHYTHGSVFGVHSTCIEYTNVWDSALFNGNGGYLTEQDMDNNHCSSLPTCCSGIFCKYGDFSADRRCYGSPGSLHTTECGSTAADTACAICWSSSNCH